MKNPNYVYVKQLPLEIQEKVKADLRESLTKSGLSGYRLEHEVAKVTFSKIEDLAETTNIHEYVADHLETLYCEHYGIVNYTRDGYTMVYTERWFEGDWVTYQATVDLKTYEETRKQI